MSEKQVSEDLVLFGWITAMAALLPLGIGLALGAAYNYWHVAIISGLIILNGFMCEIVSLIVARVYEK